MSNLTHRKPEYPALERAYERWGLANEDPTIVRINVALRTSRRPKPFMPRKEPRFLTDPTYWRRQAAALHVCDECDECDGRGWVYQLDESGVVPATCPTCGGADAFGDPSDDSELIPF